jgi:hypothetical protein
LLSGEPVSAPKLSALIGLIALAALALLLWRSERSAPSGEGHAGAATVPSAPPRVERTESGEDGSSKSSDRLAPETAERAELASLEGTLKVSGEDLPLAGFLISIEGGPTRPTDAAGAFEFHGLAPGTARLTVDTSGTFEPLERALELAPGANRVELRLAPRFELSVVVVEQVALPGEARQPIAGASVRLENALETASFFQRKAEFVAGQGGTDARGRCTLSGIAAGEYALVVEAEGHIASRVPLSCRYRDVSSRARPRTILMALAASDRVLRGRVKGPDRQPVAGALVCLDTSTQKQRTFARVVAGVTLPSPPYTFSDSQGAFELPLPEGELQLALIVCGRDLDLSPIARHVVPIEHLEREVAVELASARRVELVVLGPDEDGVVGRLGVSDGVLDYDLVSHPVLAAIPGFVGLLAKPSDFMGSEFRLSLPDGGYEVRFDVGARVLGSWFVQVGEGHPDRIELRLPD